MKNNNNQQFNYMLPEEIEKRSFEIIKSELLRPLDPELAPIIMRVIHTTADFGYAESLAFSKDVTKHAISSLRQGIQIVCDTNMVKAGVDKARLQALGGDIHCFIKDEDVIEKAKQEMGARLEDVVIVKEIYVPKKIVNFVVKVS